MAMKLLEKDIHEKQDTIVSLRRQLEDIKQINLEMYNKLQVYKFTELLQIQFYSTFSNFYFLLFFNIYLNLILRQFLSLNIACVREYFFILNLCF